MEQYVQQLLADIQSATENVAVPWIEKEAYDRFAAAQIPLILITYDKSRPLVLLCYFKINHIYSPQGTQRTQKKSQKNKGF
jgi:hypothetical protein